jgi:rRNA maturation endonuclease Nob1
MLYCPKHGFQGWEMKKTRYCPDCGAKLESLKCPHCGFIYILPSHKYCTNCGKPLTKESLMQSIYGD